MDNVTPPVPSYLPTADNLWFFEIIIGILVLIAVYLIFRRVVKHLRQRSISLSHDWKEKIDQILSLPFKILIWILGVTLVIQILGRRFDFSFFENYIDAFRSTGFVFCLSWMFLRWKAEAQRRFVSRDKQLQKVDTGFIQIISNVISMVIITIALMIILQVWGLNIAPLIAFGGIGAAAIGFAAKDVIANFFGGLMLHLNRPFMIGDLILLPGEHLEGHVEEVGLYLTTVRDKDKRPVYLPNALFSHALVINSSRMTHSRIEEKIGIRYDDFSKIPVLTENLKKAIANHSDIDTHMPVLAVFHSFSQCTLNLYIDVYTLQTRYDKYLQVRHEILVVIYEEVKKAGAEMPIPMMTIYNGNG